MCRYVRPCIICIESVVKRILVVDTCIEDMAKEVELRCRLDLLDDGEQVLCTGSRNILISESIYYSRQKKGKKKLNEK